MLFGKSKYTALHDAAQNGHVDVAVLIENDADLNAVGGYFKETPLPRSSVRHVDVAKVLIRNGADLNSVDSNDVQRFTSQREGRVDVAKVLIQNGADMNAVTQTLKKTALFAAIEKGHIDIAKMLIHYGADVVVLRRLRFTTQLYGHVDVVKVLIQNGADVNAVEKLKQTALHWAAESRHVDAVKVLLRNSADVNTVDENKWTALHHAAATGHVDVQLTLLCFGAQIDEDSIQAFDGLFLGQMNDRLESLRAVHGMKANLLGREERRFMWNLAFSLAVSHRVVAFKVYYFIRSFITWNGFFMGPGYECGSDRHLVHVMIDGKNKFAMIHKKLLSPEGKSVSSSTPIKFTREPGLLD